MSGYHVKLFRNGRFVGERTREAAQQLYNGGFVTLEHNHKGFVVAAHERTVAQDPGMANAVHRGVTYSYQEIPEVLWDLKRLDGSRKGLNYAPRSMRIEFLRVIESVKK